MRRIGVKADAAGALMTPKFPEGSEQAARDFAAMIHGRGMELH